MLMAIGIEKGPRTPLVISSSSDEGKTWRTVLTLEAKPPPAGFSEIVALDTVCIGCIHAFDSKPDSRI